MTDPIARPRVRALASHSMIQEFKAFIMRGNVLDLAVGLIIGAAFGTIVSSLVNDVIMPPIGLALGGVDFAQSYMLLKAGATVAPPYASLDAAKAAGAVTLRYGVFINALITFVIVAFAIFLLVKAVMSMSRKEAAKEAAAPTPENACPQCRMTIPLGATRCGHCTSTLA